VAKDRKAEPVRMLRLARSILLAIENKTAGSLMDMIYQDQLTVILKAHDICKATTNGTN
jgi:hypothetical protein